ncbi:hypothetical protein ACFC08_07655 [Streptomyces sp. NPDC056112]|uniref:hypothetical protein n=1 Tax=Streptomyces sp. NPDC056112 TaxID=3345715 RepID=UPI0035E3BB4E
MSDGGVRQNKRGRFVRRGTVGLAVLALASAGLFAAGPASASSSGAASPAGRLMMPGSGAQKSAAPQGGAGIQSVYKLPISGGYGQWSDNPSGSTPGDAIKACDTSADGWGIETWLDYNRDGYVDRIASTRGHNSPYCSPWATGNLPEDIPVDIAVIQVKGSQTGAWAQWVAYT